MRIHYIKEKTQELVSKEEFYRCGKFLIMNESDSLSDLFLGWEVHLCDK